MSELVVRRGTGSTWQQLEPGTGALTWIGLTVVELAEPYQVGPSDMESLVVPLAGHGRVTAGGSSYELTGRTSPFDGPTDAAYVPRDTGLVVEGEGRFVIASAVAEPGPHQPAYLPREDVRVLGRGGGSMSRLVREYAMPEAFTATSRLLVCEVVTPAGNWSGYPAHKHDTQSATESELEEIYYYEFAPGPNGEPGFGLHETTASDERPIDVHVEVRTGDVALVPYGWHGPCAACPGHDMYFLNVMAGPSTSKDWRITDHPEHAWVRETWPGLGLDPRVVAGLD